MSRILALIMFLIMWPNVIFAKSLTTDRPTHQTPEINRDILKLYYKPNFPKSQYDIIPYEPNTIYYDFEGFQSVITKEIRNQFRSWHINSLKDTYGNDYLNHITDGRDDMWPTQPNRNWWEYFPLDKGGCVASRIIQIGDTHEVFKLGPFSLYNDLRIKFRTEGIQMDGDVQDQTRYRDPEINPRFRIEETLAFHGTNLRPRIKPSISFKLSGTDPLEIVRQLNLKVEIGIYSNSGKHVANLATTFRYYPATNETYASVEFELVNF